MSLLNHRYAQRIKSDGLISFIKQAVKYVYKNTRLMIEKRALFHYPKYTQFLAWWNTGCGQYSPTLKPFEKILVDPATITHVTGREPFPGKFLRQDIGKVMWGDWDRTNELFRELPRVIAIRERFLEEKMWKEVDVVRDHINREKSTSQFTWDSVDDLNDWCASVDTLYESIQTHGYLSKRKVNERFEHIDSINRNYECMVHKPMDVAVDISRNGDLLFVNGRHRLAIAQILEVEQIPVNVVVRHRGWQQKRDYVHANQDLSGYGSHPDLRDIV